MENLIPEQKVLDKRFQQFHSKIKSICNSPKNFKNGFDVQIGHIAWRAAQTMTDVRNAISNEKIASILIHGRVNEKHCNSSKPLELVVEGRFAELIVVEFNPIQEKKIKDVSIRVVVREGSPKHIIVTLYPLTSEANVSSIPEVPNEVW
ncbi:MAG: hypothetical protein HQK54_08385 [Oligoflexales bacterium]|nr:hypothetical protein [Oligoflexales bacterium]